MLFLFHEILTEMKRYTLLLMFMALIYTGLYGQAGGGVIRGQVVDATAGHRTRTVLFMDTGQLVLSALSTETLANRVRRHGSRFDRVELAEGRRLARYRRWFARYAPEVPVRVDGRVWSTLPQ